MLEANFYKRVAYALCVLLVSAMGCGTDVKPPGGDDDDPPPPPPPVTDPGVFATRPSRSSTIAITEDNSHIAMVNPDDGSLSVFVAADNKTAYVANRGDATVVKVSGIDGGTPQVSATTDVGAEPAGLALSPSGKRLFVAEFAASRVSVINTSTMAIETSIPVDRPRA